MLQNRDRHYKDNGLALRDKHLGLLCRSSILKTPYLPSPLTKLFCPILILLQALFADTGSNIDQTRFKVLNLDRSYFIGRHVQQRLAQTPEWTHRRIFR